VAGTRKASKNGKRSRKPDKPPRRRSTDLPRMSPKVIRAVLAGAIGIALLAVLYVQKDILHASPACQRRLARVRLVKPPSWMPRELAYVITSQIQTAAFDAEGTQRSVFEEGIARDVCKKADENPWIAHVDRVKRRPDGVVDVEARYHRPRAMVGSSSMPIPVTIDGVVLPRVDATLLKVADFKVIQGVVGHPPEPGKHWDAPDLADGLKVLRLFWKKPYVKEITVIDVSNHGGRINPTRPHIVLIAQMRGWRQTEVAFGRLPVGDDYVVSTERKMANLDAYCKARGWHLSGRDERVDVRLDELLVTPYDRGR